MIAVEKQLDQTDKAIIEKIQAGKTYKEIARDLYITYWMVVRRIRNMKEYYQCKSLTQLYAVVSKSAA